MTRRSLAKSADQRVQPTGGEPSSRAIRHQIADISEFERYFVDAGQPAEHDGLPPAAPPDIPLLTRAAQKFGAEIVGPPLQLRAVEEG